MNKLSQIFRVIYLHGIKKVLLITLKGFFNNYKFANIVERFEVKSLHVRLLKNLRNGLTFLRLKKAPYGCFFNVLSNCK